MTKNIRYLVWNRGARRSFYKSTKYFWLRVLGALIIDVIPVT